MPFPPTPSPTASITPTPSITASVTPTYSPTRTNCPTSTPIVIPCLSYTACKKSTFLSQSFVEYTDCYGIEQVVYVENPPNTYPECVSFCALEGTLNYLDTEIEVTINGDCVVPTLTPTTTPTNTPTPSITPTIGVSPTNTPTQTSTPSSTPETGVLYVYAKFRNAENILQYQINYGTTEVIGNIDSLTCQYFYTITGLSVGDTIYFTTYSTCVLALDTPPSTCPNSGFACSQTYTWTGNDYVYITVDGSICC